MIHNAPLRKRPYLRVGAIHQKQQQTMLARQEGAPAQMALCESVGRKAAGGGDENAARVDAMNEQPVKHKFRFIPAGNLLAGTGAEFDGTRFTAYFSLQTARRPI